MFHLYGLIVGVAIVVGWSLAERIEPRVSKPLPWIIVFGLIGARLFHVVEALGYYQNNLLGIIKVWEGGMSIWGAMIGGSLAMWFYFKNNIFEILSKVIIALPLSQAIGRIGNGVNGEFTKLVLGIPWWGMEAILDFCLFGLLWIIPVRWRVIVYIVGYGLIRLVLNPYR